MPLFVFDAYGTLFDVHAAIRRYSTGPDADRMSEIWRAKQLEYTWTLTLAGRYADFWILTERALDFALARVQSVKVLASIPVPLDTKDFVPYLAQVPADTEVLLPAFIGPLAVAFYTQSRSMGFDKRNIKMFSQSPSIEAIAPDDIGDTAEVPYFFVTFPRLLIAKDYSFHRAHNKL